MIEKAKHQIELYIFLFTFVIVYFFVLFHLFILCFIFSFQHFLRITCSLH